jgi:murein DD-endopeptidase MepM/ murein hydrolase activator NlpD
MSKLTERMSLVYESAAADRNSARSLTDQAEVAQQTLGALSKKAETALAEAMAASIQVETALADQQEIAGTLQAQLAVLSEDRAATEADYAAGEDIRRATEAAAAKARAAQAAVAAATAAATTTASNTVSGQGWALPVSGWISSWFGPRPNKPVAGVGAFHHGTDIAAGCGRNVYAASAGTVVYAGWLGSYGNWVLIDHGDGTQTGYAHNSSLLVSPGQQVSAGATIALVGTTGASSGCHVHFETRVNGARVDPQAFMSARGVTLG